MSENTLKLPPAIFAAIEDKLTEQERYARKSQEAESAAQSLLREYCEALGFPPQSQYQYRRGSAIVVAIPPATQQPTTTTTTTDATQET